MCAALGPRRYVHVAFAPSIRMVSTVRRFAGDFYTRVLVDSELASRVALATHELLDNAVAYASDGETEVLIEIRESELAIETRNRATPENLAALLAAIEAIDRAHDPNQYYQQLLDRSVRHAAGSGLGLARVRAEADMFLGCKIDPDRHVRVSARTACKEGRAA